MGTSDFWALRGDDGLKDETKNFIPAIQAATLIAREPERYGFVVTPAPPLTYELVSVPRSTNLKRLAGRVDIRIDALERLNTELKLNQTPPEASLSSEGAVRRGKQVPAVLDREVVARHATP